MDLISVVVPVYNVELFLEHCLNSLINQTYKNIEIVVVDDGSTDTSGEICDNFAEKDSRIKVLHTENGGLSAARNVGIENSNGEYICFVDSDDWIDLNMIEQLYSAITLNGADYAVCGMKDEFRDMPLAPSKTASWNYCGLKDALEHILCDEDYYGYACNKMYKKELMGNLRFDEKLLSCEDLDFVVKFTTACKNIAYTNEKMYHYRHHGQSMTGDMKYNVRKLSILDAYENITPIYKQYRADLLPIIEKNYLKIAINILGRMKISKVEDREVSQRLGGIIKEYYPKVMKSSVGIKAKLNIFISKNFPSLILRVKQKIIKLKQRKNYA